MFGKLINKREIVSLFAVLSLGGVSATKAQTSIISANGTVTVRELVVTNNGWSDFVFQKGYTPATPDQVEKQIRANGHLPGIPSQSEVKEKGVSVGEMQAKLLQKVEELTLWAIEQNKKIDHLSEENAELKKAIAKK